MKSIITLFFAFAAINTATAQKKLSVDSYNYVDYIQIISQNGIADTFPKDHIKLWFNDTISFVQVIRPIETVYGVIQFEDGASKSDSEYVQKNNDKFKAQYLNKMFNTFRQYSDCNRLGTYMDYDVRDAIVTAYTYKIKKVDYLLLSDTNKTILGVPCKIAVKYGKNSGGNNDTTVLWYAPGIPNNYGPFFEDYSNPDLVGLVLEMQYKCYPFLQTVGAISLQMPSEVRGNFEEEVPASSILSYEEYRKLVDKKYK